MSATIQHNQFTAGLSRFGPAGCLTELGIVHQGIVRRKKHVHVCISQSLDVTRPAKEFRKAKTRQPGLLVTYS